MYSDYYRHLYRYIHNVSTEASFGFLQVFLVKLGSLHRTSNQTLYLIHWADCSDSIYNNHVQVLNYIKCSQLLLPVDRIEPATSRLFHLEVLEPNAYNNKDVHNSPSKLNDENYQVSTQELKLIIYPYLIQLTRRKNQKALNTNVHLILKLHFNKKKIG